LVVLMHVTGSGRALWQRIVPSRRFLASLRIMAGLPLSAGLYTAVVY